MSRGSYFRPLVQVGPARPDTALPLAGGWGWFTQVEVLHRTDPARIVQAQDVPQAALARLTAPRAPVAGITFGRPQVMGILNTTPDSFSDGGLHHRSPDAVAAGLAMRAAGAALLDVGGESTRPGAQEVDPEQEIARIQPVISALHAAGPGAISVDTRKAAVADAALTAGASMVNDVSGFTFDPSLASLCAARGAPVCVMHGPADPATMQDDPRYDDVLLDVFDFLADRIAALEAQGIARRRIIADPGIGFGKTQAHNLALLARLSLFHDLGVPILLGASRKRFIGTLSGVAEAAARMPGSLGVALAALGQGVQMLRVHDVAQTVQAVTLWEASSGITRAG